MNGWKNFIRGCPTANFEPLPRGQPHQLDVNHCILTILTHGHRELRNEVGSLGPAERLVGIEPGNFRFLPTRPLSPNKISNKIDSQIISKISKIQVTPPRFFLVPPFLKILRFVFLFHRNRQMIGH